MSSVSTTTDLDMDLGDFFDDIDGALRQRFIRAIQMASANQHDNGDGKTKAEVTITFKIKKGPTSDDQMIVSGQMSYNYPTSIGKKSESVDFAASMFVGKRGKLTLAKPVSDYDMLGENPRRIGESTE